MMKITSSGVSILNHWLKPRYLQEILLGILPFLIAGQLMSIIVLFPAGLRGQVDFRHLYTAGYMVRTGYGHELYNYDAQKRFQSQFVAGRQPTLPFVRPAYQALFFMPLSLLRYRDAYLIFLCFNLCLLGICFLLLGSKLCGLACRHRWLPAALFLSFLPVSLALLQGQDTIILMALFTGAWVLLDSKRDLIAGLLVGLGLFKLQLVIPILLIFIIGRRWRFVRGLTAAAVVVSIVSVWVVGFEGTWAFSKSLWSVGSGFASQDHSVDVLFMTTFMPNLRGLIFGLFAGRLPMFWVQFMTLFSSLAVLISAAVWGRENLQGPKGFELALSASALASYYFFIHDFTIMLIPILMVLSRTMGSDEEQNLSHRLSAWFAALLILTPLITFLALKHFYLVALPLAGFLGTLVFGSKRMLFSDALQEKRIAPQLN